jgi:glycosyltransferase involved in cell wall biosynthesis
MTRGYKEEIIFVNSFRGSGIGDFGWKLKCELEGKLRIKYLEITPSWKGFIRLWKMLMLSNLQVIFNLGFTSFGKSIYRNFFNFLMLKLYSITHPWQSVILHDSIDTSNLENTGYSNSRLLPVGGAIATKMLKNYNIFVFSKTFHDVLKKKYGIINVNYFPFPTENGTILECYKPDKEPLLLNMGYIAPYKGLAILPEIRTKLNNIKTIIVGDFYSSLLLTKNGPKFKEELVTLMRNSGITMFGYMNDARLIELVKEYQTVAILPYISGYNASYSAIFFVTLGIPVVATNLDIFLESQRNGAGIVLVDRTPDAFATAISTILNSSDTTRHLIEDDRKYCARYSIHNFCDFLIDEAKRVT